MFNSSRIALAVAAACGAAFAARSHAQDFHILRNVAGAPVATVGKAISADGHFILGTAGNSANTSAPVFWRAEADLPANPLAIFQGVIAALHISSDGRIFAGFRFGTPNTTWRCALGGDCAVPIPGAPSIWGNTLGMSGDGTTFIHTIYLPGQPIRYGWFRSGEPPREFDLPFYLLPAALSENGDVSFFMTNAGLYRFIAGDEAPVPLGLILPFPNVLACTRDGSMLFYNSGSQLFRWSEADGSVAIPGCCEGNPRVISRDGRTVLGYAQLNEDPWVWDQFRGRRFLTDIFPGMTVLDYPFPSSVSDDGRIIVGSSSGVRGWIATLPDNSCAADYNLDGNRDQDDVWALLNLIAGADNPWLLPLDFNRDGANDVNDLGDLINVIAGGACP